MTCDGVHHNLLAIFIHYKAASEAVVRWCVDCGAVVIDEDSDNRTSPGRYMSMRFPTMNYPNQKR
jgi:hypothetical protein